MINKMLLWLGMVYTALHFSMLPPLSRVPGHKWLRWLFAIMIAAGMCVASLPFRSPFTAFFLYMCMGYVISDVTQLWMRKRNTAFAVIWKRLYVWSVLPLVLGLSLCVGGYINARIIHTTKYEVRLANAPENGLRIAFLSDVHVGTSVRQKHIPNIVARVNNLQPDVIILGGDIFDENSTAEDMAVTLRALTALQATQGIYFVPGNHEYQAHRRGTLHMQSLLEEMRQAGIKTMTDETLIVDGQFTLVGRNDPGGTSLYGRKRLSELLTGANPVFPVIVVDHRPLDQAEAAYAGVNLQISGHTHNGQIFPVGIVSRILGLNEMEYGHRQSGAYHAIVGSGAGTWALPVRVGSKSEIVLIEVR